MFSSLMTSRRFAPLFWCQFFSAFNDNLLKNALVILLLYAIGSEGAASLVTLAAAVFIAPSFLLSGLGGQLADRYNKSLIAQRLKFAEIGVAAVAVVGFAFQSEQALFAALFGFGVIAALFGPIKYGILPDHLQRQELPAGNALVEGATFLAILFGTIVGAFAAAHGGHPIAFGLVMMAFAVLCWIASRFIPKTVEAAPSLRIDPNILRSTVSLLRFIRPDARVRRCALMVSWFWVTGAITASLLPTLVQGTLAGTEETVMACNALFAVGIAIGSATAAWLASGRIVLLPTPIAAVFIGLFMLDLAYSTIVSSPPEAGLGVLGFFATAQGLHLAVDLVGMSIAAGILIVPAFAAVQAWSDPSNRARVIAGINVLSSALMVAGTLFMAFLQSRGLTTPAAFSLLGLANIVVGAVIFRFLPTSPLRDFLSILFRAFYRLEVRGFENLNAGPNTIIALNHVSFLDAALALSLLDEDPVFAIYSGIAKKWWAKPFVRLTRAMPLDPTRPIATRTLINAVKGGDKLVIFPEGRITVTGSLMKVYDGAGLIADKSDALVVPVRIEGLERTFFSRLSRAQVRRRWWPKVIVTALEPVKLTISPELKGKHRRQAAGAVLYQIMSDLVFRTTSTERTVFAAVAEAARSHGRRRTAIEDPVTGGLSYRRLLLAATVLAEKFAPLAPVGSAIGVMLPNSNGAVVSILGLMSAGRVPAMINFSAGLTNILAACRAADVTTIVSARAFVEKAKLGDLARALEATVRIVYLEDVRATVGIGDRLRALGNGDRPFVDRAPDDPAAILFTSGSEGTPKGVVLSHRNMLANAAQGAARIDFGRADKVFNVLPLFHSFGLTVGLILPLVSGVRVYLYPSPLHYRIVPELIYGSNATILFGTDTFLAGYARTAHAYDFRSLRYILAGAEPVKEATRHLYMEKFGMRILEGYGVTEAAPALALNTPMFNKFGTVGRLLPGMEVRLEPVPGIEDGGRLFVRGPNVMLGYLHAETPGVLEPPHGGWHDTGDVVSVDANGFITIKGRAKRFAKIAGEMISLAAVEALAAEFWPGSQSAVTAIPDERKGEKLLMVTDRALATRNEFMKFARMKGASELMTPSEILVVATVPVLGSGKVDNIAVAKLVAELRKQPQIA